MPCLFNSIKQMILWPFFIFMALWIVGFASFVIYSNTFSQKSVYPCDGFVVFTGFLDRITPGAQLFQQHCHADHLPKLLLSGVDPGSTLQDFNIFRSFPERSIQPQDITLGTARNTIENAMETVIWAKKNDIKHLCLITNRYHVPRSLLELRHAQRMLEKDADSSFYTQSIEVYPLEHTKEWWKEKDRFSFLLIEYHKYIIRFILTWFQ